MVEFHVYVKIDNVKGTYAFDEAKSEKLITMDESEARMHFNKLCKEINSYAPVDPVGKVHVCIDKHCKGFTRSSFYNEKRFSLTGKLKCLLRGSEVKFD